MIIAHENKVCEVATVPLGITYYPLDQTMWTTTDTVCSKKNYLGDVLSGTSSTGVHHSGVFEGWFGPHMWNSRPIVLLATTLLVFAPLVSFKRLGKHVVH
jgi:hypothetical protein